MGSDQLQIRAGSWDFMFYRDRTEVLPVVKARNIWNTTSPANSLA